MRPCDLCSETASLDTPGDPSGKIRICSGCGFVHVKERRSVAEIAASWSDIYRSGGYDPDWPGVKARLFYVAEWLDRHLGLRGKSMLDIGAGNGQFLAYCSNRGAYSCGLDPDRDNCEKMRRSVIAAVEGYANDERPAPLDLFDIVTLNWTLENTGDCLEVLRYAKRCLKLDGHIVVATGSRILAPFKKPLSSYLPQDPDYPHDTHCFRWSMWSIAEALSKVGMYVVGANDCIDRDEMVVVAQIAEPYSLHRHPSATTAQQVENHFLRWQTCFP